MLILKMWVRDPRYGSLLTLHNVVSKGRPTES